MKRVFYILFVFLLGAVACSKKELMVSPEEGEARVTIDMMVSFPQTLQATKGEMADLPNIDNIYVAVYGKSHYLNDYAKAIPIDDSGNVLDSYASLNGTDYRVRVTLLASTSQRYVHIIANGPDHLDYQTTEDLMLTLKTTGTDSGYWQYFPLPYGTAKLNEGKWVPSDDAQAKFSNVRLIRNFARIKVTSTAAHFTLKGFHVYQTPKKGSYSMPTDDSGSAYLSAVDYAAVGDQTDKIEYIHNTLMYDGYMLPLEDGETLKETPKSSDSFYLDAFQYVYESPNIANDQDCPFIIIKGRYEGDADDTYYKIEMMDDMGHRFPIYRNLDYTINLKAVGKSGVSDPASAITSNSNISTEAVELSEISDGISGLYVLFTEKTFVVPDEDGKTVSFQYKYVPDLKSSTVTGTRTITLADNGTAIVIPEDEGTSWYSESGPDSDGWYTITFKVKQSSSSDLISKFTVMGTNSATEGKLYREILVRVIPRPELSGVSLTQASSAVNANVTLQFTLPDLPASVFPLVFQIKDSGGCLNPRGDDMPVESKDNSFYFVKTISLTDYNQSKVVTCNMKRIKTGSTSVTINNPDGYFNPKTTGTIE